MHINRSNQTKFFYDMSIESMAKPATITLNGSRLTVSDEISVAAAILAAGVGAFRKSVSGESRGPLCGMGICFECRVTIDGVMHSRSCQITCVDGMEVVTDDHH